MIFTQYSKRPRYDAEDDVRYLHQEPPSVMYQFISKMVVTGVNLAQRTCKYLLPNKKTNLVTIDLKEVNKAVATVQKKKKQQAEKKNQRKIYAIKKIETKSLQVRLKEELKKEQQNRGKMIVTESIDPFARISKCLKYQMLVDPNYIIYEKQQVSTQKSQSSIKIQLQNEATILKKQRNLSQEINDDTQTIYKQKKNKQQLNEPLIDNIKAQINTAQNQHQQMNFIHENQQLSFEKVQALPEINQSQSQNQTHNLLIDNPFKTIRGDMLSLKSIIHNYQPTSANFVKDQQQTYFNSHNESVFNNMRDNTICKYNNFTDSLGNSFSRGVQLLLPKNYQSSNQSLFQFPKNQPVNRRGSKRSRGPEKLRIS